MKVSSLLFPLALVVAPSVLVFAQERPASEALLPPPRLTKVRLSVDGKSLEIAKIVERMVPERYTVMVPIKRMKIIDGAQVETTEYETKSMTRMAAVQSMVCEPLTLDDQLELRTASGGRHALADLNKLVGTDFTPAIVLQRQWVPGEGQRIAKTTPFDRSFFQLFSPDALVLILPPASAPPALPAAVPMPQPPMPQPPMPQPPPQPPIAPSVPAAANPAAAGIP